MPFLNKKIIFALFIIICGTALRLFLNEKIGIPNFEPVTSIGIVSGSLFGGIYGASITLLIMFFSDIVFRNTYIFLFTWSSFALIGIFGALIKRNSKHYFLKMMSGGVGAVLFFYLFTNFGWWLISGMYPMNFLGLLQSYIAGLPFLKNQLVSVLIFTPVFLTVFSFFYDRIKIREIFARGITKVKLFR